MQFGLLYDFRNPKRWEQPPPSFTRSCWNL